MSQESTEISRSESLRPIAEVLLRAGATMLPGGAAATVIFDFIRDASANRAHEVVDRVVDIVGMQRLADRLAVDEEVSIIFVVAVEAAMRTALESKRELMAKVAANAVLDQARIDESRLVIDALRDLDGPHIRALARLADADAARSPATSEGGTGDFSKAVGAEHDAVLAGLLRHGLVLQNTTYDGPQVISGVSKFGHSLLDQLGVHDRPGALRER